MPIKTKLNDDLKDAMRNRDIVRRSTLRLALSEIHNQEIANQKDLTDDDVIQLLGRQAQQRRDSIEAFEKGDRQELADKEKVELEIILGYLPQQLTHEEITDIVREVVEASGASGPEDMGRVMGQLMPRVRGKAEGRVVSTIVNEMLKGLAG